METIFILITIAAVSWIGYKGYKMLSEDPVIEKKPKKKGGASSTSEAVTGERIKEAKEWKI